MPTVGWSVLCACAVYCSALAWKARGAFDNFLTNQNSDRQLAQTTLKTIEDAKKLALSAVETAKKEGDEKAQQILREVGVLDTNHLSHIEAGVGQQNVKLDRLIEMQGKHLEIAADMKTSLAILVDRTGKSQES
jgi:hypothetical protein